MECDDTRELSSKRLFDGSTAVADQLKEVILDQGEGKPSSQEGRTPPASNVLQNITNSSKQQLNGRQQKGTPLGMLQAKQCKDLEEEFSKNQQNILEQLHQADENVAPIIASTQFVEEI